MHLQTSQPLAGLGYILSHYCKFTFQRCSCRSTLPIGSKLTTTMSFKQWLLEWFRIFIVLCQKKSKCIQTHNKSPHGGKGQCANQRMKKLVTERQKDPGQTEASQSLKISKSYPNLSNL